MTVGDVAAERDSRGPCERVSVSHVCAQRVVDEEPTDQRLALSQQCSFTVSVAWTDPIAAHSTPEHAALAHDGTDPGGGGSGNTQR